MDSNVQKKLQELFLIYTKNLPLKIKKIEEHWLSLLQHWDKKEFLVFHREVHSLCGSSGTYGYVELSKKARQMEICLKRFLNADALTEEMKNTITSYLEELKWVLSIPAPAPISSFESKVESSQKRVFLVEDDEEAVKDLLSELKYAGYEVFHIPSEGWFDALKQATPAAIILNSMLLNEGNVHQVSEYLKAQNITLFCLLPDASLLPRITAVRAGCEAFFEKPIDLFDLIQTLNQKWGARSEPYRILIIDDSESLAEYYALILNEVGMITRVISNPLLLFEGLEVFQPDLLLMDIYMPYCTGLELASVMRKEHRYMRIPIVFLSTEEDRRKQLSAISLGGDDFLTKPVAPQHLISTVRSRAKRAGALNYFMMTDSLTGLLNHSSILERLDVEMMHARQKHLPVSFIMIDIDHFKKINDEYGHPAGDVVLKKLATLLQIRLRSQDIVGRYGGEEFAVILPGTSSDKSSKLCDELRQQFAASLFQAGASEFSVTFSAGVSSCDGSWDSRSLVEKADHALYSAKKQGRNRVIVEN